MVSLIIETERFKGKGRDCLSRVGDSLLSAGDVAAGAANDIALGVAVDGVLGETRVDGVGLDGGLLAIVTALAGVLSVRLAVVVKLSRGLALDGLAKTGVDILGSGTDNGA